MNNSIHSSVDVGSVWGIEQVYDAHGNPANLHKLGFQEVILVENPVDGSRDAYRFEGKGLELLGTEGKIKVTPLENRDYSNPDTPITRLGRKTLLVSIKEWGNPDLLEL